MLFGHGMISGSQAFQHANIHNLALRIGSDFFVLRTCLFNLGNHSSSHCTAGTSPGHVHQLDFSGYDEFMTTLEDLD